MIHGSSLLSFKGPPKNKLKNALNLYQYTLTQTYLIENVFSVAIFSSVKVIFSLGGSSLALGKTPSEYCV